MSKDSLKLPIMICQAYRLSTEGLRREVGLLESKKESLEKQIFDLHTTLAQRLQMIQQLLYHHQQNSYQNKKIENIS